MGKYDSKRVLHIGRYVWTRQNIDYIKDNGAYMIVADKCPPEQNPYRDLVDEVVQLDIDNTDEVIAYCHTAAQWQTFVNKKNFRKLCIEHEINVPTTYYAGPATELTDEIKDTISFPIIVKPVDNAGGIGISVVFEKCDLAKAIDYAALNSATSSIIIEEFIEGREVIFTYMIQNAYYKLTASADKYVYKDKRNLTVIPDLYMYPCDDHDLYESTVNDKVLAMLKSQGLNNCTIFFQTIEKDGIFYFFEAGLRYEGTSTYDITSYYTGQNASDFYYDYLLKTETDYNIQLDDPRLNGNRIAMYVVHLKQGKIRRIKGASKIRNNEKILLRSYLQGQGCTIGNSPLEAVFASYCMDASDKNDLAEQIRFIKHALKVRDRFNRNMIIDSFDETILLN